MYLFMSVIFYTNVFLLLPVPFCHLCIYCTLCSILQKQHYFLHRLNEVAFTLQIFQKSNVYKWEKCTFLTPPPTNPPPFLTTHAACHLSYKKIITVFTISVVIITTTHPMYPMLHILVFSKTINEFFFQRMINWNIILTQTLMLPKVNSYPNSVTNPDPILPLA